MEVSPIAKLIPTVTGAYPKEFESIVNLLTSNGGNDKEIFRKGLWPAYQFSKAHHEGQYRRSGKPHFEHCYAVAKSLAEWEMDLAMVVSGLLHDTIEDTDATYEELVENFGQEVADLVDGVTKLGEIEFQSRQERQAENLMKMFLSMAQDIRVIIIKFADRLHNMKTIEHLPLLKQRRIAIETRDLYSPLAHRLGMFSIKQQLDDLALKTIEPDAYKEIGKELRSTQSYRKKHIKEVSNTIKKELDSHNILANITSRLKSYYSIYGKMQYHNKPLSEIYDILAIRIIVHDVAQCYSVLGIIHQLYTPVQEHFNDFIATPKINGYQSLHTTVVSSSGRMVEIQIRTEEMDQTAEIGVAAHWKYKEQESKGGDLDKHIQWLRDLVSILKDESADPAEFMNLLQIDLFKDEVFVFTPKGDLVQLPAGSTPIDFAYDVHTEVGNHCISAKVDGRLIPLKTKLVSGSTVEIITSDSQTPSYTWLKLVRTGKARLAIRRWIRKREEEESIKLGKEILEKTLRRLKMSGYLKEIKKSVEDLGFSDENKLYSTLGRGQTTVREIIKKISPEVTDEELTSLQEEPGSFLDRARRTARGVRIQGIDDVMMNFGKCCNPIPGDSIIGFVTRGRGVTVHRMECTNLPIMSEESDRILEVEWSVGRKDEFLSRIKIVAEDRKGYLKDVTEYIATMNINIISVDIKVEEGLATCYLEVKVPNIRRLNTITSKIKNIPGTITIERAT